MKRKDGQCNREQSIRKGVFQHGGIVELETRKEWAYLKGVPSKGGGE